MNVNTLDTIECCVVFLLGSDSKLGCSRVVVVWDWSAVMGIDSLVCVEFSNASKKETARPVR